MGRELQKKKNRSSVAKVSRRNPKKTKRQVLANTIIAENWDKNQTVAQNYQRLGLTRRLNGATGGIEMHTVDNASLDDGRGPKRDGLTIASAPKIEVSHKEAKIQRDPKTGAILRVLDDDDSAQEPKQNTPFQPLRDPLNALETSADPRSTSAVPSSIVAALYPGGSASKKRKQSTREEQWIRQLIERHGASEDDGSFEAMSRDAELNIRQQSVSDIKKRVKTYLASRR